MNNKTQDSVKIADFKAHLSQYLRNVRKGRALTLVDRHTPVARVLPYAEGTAQLSIRHATLTPDQVKLSQPHPGKIDVLRYLAEERQGYR